MIEYDQVCNFLSLFVDLIVQLYIEIVFCVRISPLTYGFLVNSSIQSLSIGCEQGICCTIAHITNVIQQNAAHSSHNVEQYCINAC